MDPRVGTRKSQSYPAALVVGVSKQPHAPTSEGVNGRPPTPAGAGNAEIIVPPREAGVHDAAVAHLRPRNQLLIRPSALWSIGHSDLPRLQLAVK